ncbi:MAG: ATP-binding cassette domain-containing protein [Acidimicrobiia bacterium]|nr:ATP-binding cassette domain-containing protein [Acidimicrobiia bacterium]
MSSAPHISMVGVTRRYGSLTALRDINLNVDPGEFLAVVGASGSGKSTLLRLMGGLETPSQGAIEIGHRKPDEVRRAKEIGWTAQRPALMPWRTVRQQIELVEHINHRAGHTVDVDGLLEMTALTEFAHALPQALSGGMQQRAALARTLATGASVWLMDEPFAALDEITRSKMVVELLELKDSVDATTIWVTHHISEAVRLADRIAVLSPRPGHVVAEVKVNLPRPRDETSMPFQQVIREVRGHLLAAEDELTG